MVRGVGVPRFDVSLGSPSEDDWLCVFVLSVVWVKGPALCVASRGVILGLGYMWRPVR